ncbi:MAG: LysM peptidoglycan-binding domain-containing protein [Hungatella hathewayi]|nr:LysM peptidoglycan-binding domain-containing protein [Hungatella hathewayi]
MGELYNPFPKLPKNIRQIGERDDMVRLYLEDYVNTYLKKLYPRGGQDLRVGLLLGSMEEQDGVPYLFVDGAMEMEDVTEDGERVIFSEAAWKKAYQNMEKMFPKRNILGWFLCGNQGTQLSPLNYWKQHGQYFAGKFQLMYLNSGLEGEEAIYITSEDGFYKLRGHSIYYERNEMMQDYMVLRKDARRIESGTGDTVIRDFRQRMDENKTQIAARRSTISMLGGLCSVLSIVVLAGGVVMFNNYEKMKEMESVIASVMPVDGKGGEHYQASKPSGSKPSVNIITDEDGDLIIEEAAGQVYPTVAEETMSPTLPETQVSEGTQSRDVSSETTAVAGGQPSTVPSLEQQETLMETAAQAANGQSTYEYVVQEGETLYGICLKFYHSMNKLDEICELNGLEDQNKIIAGQKLILPD